MIYELFKKLKSDKIFMNLESIIWKLQNPSFDELVIEFKNKILAIKCNDFFKSETFTSQNEANWWILSILE